jgi:XTP/dITP diphosphohydrolase
VTAQPWVLATRNTGKLRELRPIFADAGIAVVDLTDVGVAESPEEEKVETFESFEDNALAKARWFAGRLPGRAIVADDSGLEVIALVGAPGVRSRRWSGRSDLSGAALDAANNSLLIERLAGVTDRRARFVCAAAWCEGERECVVRGQVDGTIVESVDSAGAHGFGYDPLFFADELGMTLAQATVAEKQSVSHRGRAFAQLLRAVQQLTETP